MNTLSTYWLILTGGERSCPRGRFALTLLAAYGLYHLLLPQFVHCFVVLEQQGAGKNLLSAILILAVLALAALSLLLAFLPLSPLALLGLEGTLRSAYLQTQSAAAASTPAPDTLWLYGLGLFLGAPALLLLSAVVLGSAWRRLKDAGRSPLFLLLGLTYLLGFGYDGSYSAESAGLYLLGPLWLIILYAQPSAPAPRFEIFRPCPK